MIRLWLVVQVLKTGISNTIVGQALVKNICHLLDLQREAVVVHSYRDINHCVDTLANIGCSLKNNLVFFEFSPG